MSSSYTLKELAQFVKAQLPPEPDLVRASTRGSRITRLLTTAKNSQAIFAPHLGSRPKRYGPEESQTILLAAAVQVLHSEPPDNFRLANLGIAPDIFVSAANSLAQVPQSREV